VEWLLLGFTRTSVQQKSQETMPMSNSVKTRKSDSHVDAWAIFFMIVVVVATAVYWVSHQ
jgi:hypothetical protein